MFSLRTFVLASTAATALVTSGCAKDPSKEAPAAKVSDPVPEAAPEAKPEEKPAEPAPAASPTAAAEPALEGIALSGTVSAVGSKVTGSHALTFKEWKGALLLKDGKPDGGKLTVIIQAASVDETSDNMMKEKLVGHLKSPDFFDVEKFPTASFVSSDITAAPGPNGATHKVKGKLTLRGVTKDVEFDAAIALAGKDLTGKTEFSINRKDFGIVYTGKADDLIRDGVVLKIDAKATLP